MTITLPATKVATILTDERALFEACDDLSHLDFQWSVIRQEYYDFSTQHAWEGWQARAALGRAVAPSDDELSYRLDRAEHTSEMLAAQRDQARAQYDRVFKIMMSVYGLIGSGDDIHLPDGRVMRLNDPNAAETLNALGRAIHAIPERLAASGSARPAGDGCKFCLGAKGDIPGNANIIGGAS